MHKTNIKNINRRKNLEFALIKRTKSVAMEKSIATFLNIYKIVYVSRDDLQKKGEKC